MTNQEIIAIWRTISRLETCLAVLGTKEQCDRFSYAGYWDEVAAVEEILKRELDNAPKQA